jgi:transporter family-2 protein
VSYFVGVICMALLALALRDPFPAAGVAARIPWWSWSGGLFGATFTALLVTGQMRASVVFDHYGWLGLAQRTIDMPRLIGVMLLIGCVLLIRR